MIVPLEKYSSKGFIYPLQNMHEVITMNLKGWPFEPLDGGATPAGDGIGPGVPG